VPDGFMAGHTAAIILAAARNNVPAAESQDHFCSGGNSPCVMVVQAEGLLSGIDIVVRHKWII